MSFLNFSLLIGNVLLEKQWQNSLLPLSEQSLTHSQGAEHVAGTRSGVAPPCEARPAMPSAWGAAVPELRLLLQSRKGFAQADSKPGAADPIGTASSAAHSFPLPVLKTGCLDLSPFVQGSSVPTYFWPDWCICVRFVEMRGGEVCSSSTSKTKAATAPLSVCSADVWMWGVSTAAVLGTASDSWLSPW